jgi:dipeptidyl-peptidase-4
MLRHAHTRRLSRTFLITCALAVTACATSSESTKPETCKDAAAPASDDQKGTPVSTDKPSVLSLERIQADPPLAGRTPMALTFSPDGSLLAFLRGSEGDASVLDLYAIALDVKDGRATAGAPFALVKTSDVVKGEAVLSEEEKMALERKRISQTGITSYVWCGESGRALLFPLDGHLHLVTLADDAARTPTVTTLTKDKGARLDPTCDPSGQRVSYVQDGELHVITVATLADEKITKKPNENVSFGVAEFIAQEEMGRYRGHWWSKDGRYLAYTEVDETPVGTKTRSRISAAGTELYTQRYPAAGEANAIVKLHVRDVAAKKSALFPLPNEDGYLARVGFVDGERVYALWQTRDQTRATLLVGDAKKPVPKAFLEETDGAFVELHDDLRFLKDGRALWKSSASGADNLMLVDDKGARQALTLGRDPVEHVVAVDETSGHVFYTRATDLGRSRHLFQAKLGIAETSVSTEKRLTRDDGTHDIMSDKNGRFFVDTKSALFSPPVTVLLDREGNEIAVLEKGGSDDWTTTVKPAVERFTVMTDDGTPLACALIKPIGATDGARAPVLHYVYGGPHASVTQDRWVRMSPVFARLAARGYAVFLVDNRGSAGRDHAFTRAIHHRFGDLEVADQKTALAALKKRSDVDPERVAVFGWSYGGYLAARLALDDDKPYAGAVAVAPVTDWALYDTHYTERYIGTPQANADVYLKSSLVARADKLDTELLVMHGLADDNVLFDHTVKLTDALVLHSKPFDMMAYPGRAHGIAGREAQLHVWRMIERFLTRTIGPGLHDRDMTTTTARSSE